MSRRLSARATACRRSRRTSFRRCTRGSSASRSRTRFIKTVPELVAEGEALLAAERREEAVARCEEALALQPDCLPAHVCMARGKLPGDDFLVHLARFHEALRPRVYLEIGVDVGRTLSLARPPTRVLGVDPALPSAATGAERAFAAP